MLAPALSQYIINERIDTPRAYYLVLLYLHVENKNPIRRRRKTAAPRRGVRVSRSSDEDVK